MKQANNTVNILKASKGVKSVSKNQRQTENYIKQNTTQYQFKKSTVSILEQQQQQQQ